MRPGQGLFGGILRSQRFQAAVRQGPVDHRQNLFRHQLPFHGHMPGQPAKGVAPVPQQIFDYRVSLFDHQNPVTGIHEWIGQGGGKRIRRAQLENRDVRAAELRQQVRHHGRRHPPGHDAKRMGLSRLNIGQVIRSQGGEFLCDPDMFFIEGFVLEKPEFGRGGPPCGFPFERRRGLIVFRSP